MTGDASPDQRADALASRQYGAIARTQALAVGLTPRQIERRLASGRWTATAEFGVYRVAAVPAGSEQRAAAAVLGGPTGTVASHLTAAALWGLCGFPARPHVTVGTTKSGRSGGAVVHRSALGRADVTEAGGLPATSPARTLVDASALVGYERLCDLVDTALYLRLTTADGIRAAMHEASARPGRAGLGRLRSALEVWTPGPHPGSPRRCA